MVKFKINDKEVQGNKEDTIWKIAKSNGINIPHLCHSDEVGYKPDGNCRACVVQVKGERTLTASCIRKPIEGMEVTTNCDAAKESQKIILELIVSCLLKSIEKSKPPSPVTKSILLPYF